MNVEDAKAALVGLEGKLAAAKDRRDKILLDVRRASAQAAAIGGIGDQSAKNSLGPLNKQAAAADSEIALVRIEISEAKRRLELAEAYYESVKAKQATERGEAKRSVLLEISAPDGRTIRQFHQSLAAAQKALQPGYVVTGQVIGAGVVSPIGPATQSFMASLLAAHGDELLEFLASHGVQGISVGLPPNAFKGNGGGIGEHDV
jgi:hypothetical protein